MSCSLCEAPLRKLWAIKGYPILPTVYNGNWISLQKCPQCETLWVYSPHEPYGSFVFMTVWPYDDTTFRQLNFIDNALILHEWQNAFIREKWQELASDEQQLVDAWRDRTYRSYNPIDSGSTFNKPKYIHQANDIKRFASQ